LLARADQAVQRVRGDACNEVLRVSYAPSVTAGIVPRALEKFQAATPGVRIELADLSSREMNDLANAGRLDLLINPEACKQRNGDREMEARRFMGKRNPRP